MPERPLIKFENVWKIYQLGKVELTVLKGINLEITPGSFVTVMGPSGSGKSTLLHIIGCLDTPTRGKVFLGYNPRTGVSASRRTLASQPTTHPLQDISLLSEDQLAQIRGKKFGFVFQQFNLLPNLNSLENVMLPMTFQGVPEEERRERAKTLLASLDLEKRIFHRPPELSGGEQQRIAIARALSNNPEVILADEPTGNLDSTTGKMIMEILINLHKKEEKTIVVVTHDPHIASYSKEIINIKDGEIIADHRAAEKVLWGKNEPR